MYKKLIDAPAQKHTSLSDHESLQRYLEEIRKIPLMTIQEEHDEAEKIFADRENHVLRNNFARRNLRLVVHIAKQYHSRTLSFADLVQEGNIGLLNAIERFDPNKQCKFSTYASWWIKQAIIKAIFEKDRTIRLPSYQMLRLNKIRKVIAEFYKEYMEIPSNEYIAEKTDFSLEDINRLQEHLEEELSLDESYSQDDEGYTLGSLIADTKYPDSKEVVFKKEMLDHTHLTLLQVLTEKEQTIIKMRKGIAPYEKPMTLQEVGDIFKITRERVRQIEAKAKHKLKVSGLEDVYSIYRNN